MNELQLLLILLIGMPFLSMVLYLIIGIIKVIYTITK